MATVTTIADTKRALLDELQALSISSATAASPAEVQVTYSQPAPDEWRSESVFFGPEMRTAEDTDYRMSTGRRKRFNTWEVELYITSAILSDPEEAEKRAFVIAGAVESFLADNPQPAEWSTSPVSSGALYVLVVGYEVDHLTDPEGFQRVEIIMTLDIKERLA